MKKTVFLFSALLVSLLPASAQVKYEKIAYKESKLEDKEVTVSTKDVFSTKAFTKFQCRIANKTDFIMIYKPEESTLNLPGGKEFTPKEKYLVVYPGETNYRVVNFSGPDFMIPQYSYKVEGIYKVSEIEKVIEAPEFALPPSINEFKAGPFSCTLMKFEKETDKTTAKFECRYNGDKVGVINSGRAGARLPNGTEAANSKIQGKSDIVLKGETQRFTLVWDRMEGGKENDMQKIKMMIFWRNTFIEATQVKLDPLTLEMKIDEALSK
ncbi:MAG: hypothetical protein PSX36_02560 [bacterium]|nr:hypothetical protein [bacterium]